MYACMHVYFYLVVCIVCAHVTLCVCVWSEDNLQKSILSFHHMDPEDQTLVARLDSTHLSSPNLKEFIS